MYGNLLPPDPKVQVGAGLGTTTSAGTVTVIPPTDIVEETGEKRTIDGLTYEFLMAPGSEAPAEMLWYIEERSEEHTSELQYLMRISYAVFCLKKKTKVKNNNESRHI